MTDQKTWEQRNLEHYHQEVTNGEHDEHCEYLANPYICHCSKRRREAAGHTEPPDDLIWQYPICPRCDYEVDSDGDGFTCTRCCASWDKTGSNSSFYDDYGDNAFTEPDAGPETEPARRGTAITTVYLPGEGPDA